jgi:topoisomerase-4 subunit A
LGNFDNGDLILVLYKDGSYELTNFDLTNRYEPKDIESLTKFEPERPISAIYFEAAQKNYFIKRFKIETTTIDKKFSFIGDTKGSKLIMATTDAHPRAEAAIEKNKGEVEKELLVIDETTEVRGWKALGNKVSAFKIKEITQKPSVPEAKPQAAPAAVEAEADDSVEEGNVQLGLFE